MNALTAQLTARAQSCPAAHPGRVPPHSIEAEEQLLSACLLDGGPALTAALGGGIRAESFYIPANRQIFAALQDLHAAGHPLETYVLAERLKATGQLDELGGFGYLVRVSGRVPTTAALGFFIEQVRDLATLRATIHAATALIEKAYAYTGDGVAAHLGRELERCTEALQECEPARAWRDVVAEARALTEERLRATPDSPPSARAIQWAWGNLEQDFQSMEPGELVVVAAYTSTYKSTLARQQALHACARQGKAVLISSFEVTDTEMAVNLAANQSGIRSRRDLPKLHPRDAAELLQGFDELAALDRFAVCHTDQTLDEIMARARAFKQRHGALDLWVVDYLQLIADCQRVGRGETEALAIARVTASLKRFAAREGCVVLLVSQLNRASDKEGNREPRLSDLHGSSGIEKDASRVVFLQRPSEIPAEFSGSGLAEAQHPADDRAWHFLRVIQAKGRNVGTGLSVLRADRATATLRRLAQAHE